MAERFYCSACTCEVNSPGAAGVGYAVKGNGHRVCYPCAGRADVREMMKHGVLRMYFTDREGVAEVTNWPGSLRFRVHGKRTGRHNIAGSRLTAWFVGPDNHEWYGIRYGRNTDLMTVRRTRRVYVQPNFIREA